MRKKLSAFVLRCTYCRLQAGADVVMLDNMKPHALHEAAKSLKAKHPHVLIEGSGGTLSEALMRQRAVADSIQTGVTKASLHEYFSEHVDIISLGALTQGVPHIDFSLKIRH